MEFKKEKLQTERLLLKPFAECNRQQMVQILMDKEIKKTYMIPDFDHEKQAEELFDKMMKSSQDIRRFIYGIHFQDVLIGFVNDCEVLDTEIEIGYVIASAHQRKGFATEAVRACIDELFRMGFTRVKAGFFQENVASCRVMQKSGMHKIDFEEDIEYKGVTHHCIYYAIDKVSS
jgi:RimJ/RimL family protein N-acetyltransferase